MYSYGSPHTAAQKQDDQHERTFSSYVRIQVVVLKTYLGRWTIGRSGERGSGISVLPARYDDDESSFMTHKCQVFCFCLRTPKPEIQVFSRSILKIWWRDHHHYVTPSQTPSRHPSLSSIATGRSSGYIAYRHRAVVCRFELWSGPQEYITY